MPLSRAFEVAVSAALRFASSPYTSSTAAAAYLGRGQDGQIATVCQAFGEGLREGLREGLWKDCGRSCGRDLDGAVKRVVKRVVDVALDGL